MSGGCEPAWASQSDITQVDKPAGKSVILWLPSGSVWAGPGYLVVIWITDNWTKYQIKHESNKFLFPGGPDLAQYAGKKHINRGRWTKVSLADK